MSQDDNGKAQPPVPGVVTVGQVLHGGRIWVGVRVQAPASSLEAAQGQAFLTVTFEPEDVRQLAERLLELANADQVAIQKSRILRPGD